MKIMKRAFAASNYVVSTKARKPDFAIIGAAQRAVRKLHFARFFHTVFTWAAKYDNEFKRWLSMPRKVLA